MSDAPRFQLLRCAPAEPPSGFDLGHVRVTLGRAHATSEGRTPDQAFMLYITATELADGLRQLLGARCKAVEVIGADSSFRLAFRRRSRSEIELEAGGHPLGCTTAIALARALASAVDELLRESPLDAADPVYADIHAALAALRATLERMPNEPKPRSRRGTR